MAFSATTFSKNSLSFSSSQSSSSSFPQTTQRRTPFRFPAFVATATAAAVKSAEAENEKPAAAAAATAQTKTATETAKPQPSAAPTARPKKPVFSMKKGQIVRVDKEKYLNSINYLSVGHPTYYTGLEYIYEDRGEVLDLKLFDTGEYALIAWVGIPTAPAWLPTEMLIKSERLNYERM